MGSRVQQALGAGLLIAGFWFGGSSFFVTRSLLTATQAAKIGTGLKIAGAALALNGQRRAAKAALARASEPELRGQTVNVRGATEGAVAVYGETVVGGAVAEFRTRNDDANKAYDAHLLLAHAFRRGGIEGPSGFFLDDQWIPYPGSWEGGLSTNARGAAHGGVPTGKYSPRDWGFRFSDTAGDGAVVMRFGDGARTGGPPFLVDAFADWTAADQGLDVVWSEWLFKLRGSTSDLFGGGPPRVRAVLKGCRVYDPRKDSTATIAGAGGKGAGSHRLDDRSTWEWSDNPALCWADYAYEHSHLRFELRHPVWAAGADYGQGAIVRTLDAAGGSETWWRAKAAHESAAADRTAAATATAAARLAATRWNELPHYAPRDSTRVDWPSVATAADRCDALVPVPGGKTEKRWRCDCALPLGHGGDLHRSNMTALLASMGGQALRIGDTWHVLAPGTATAGPTFGAASIGEYQLRSNLPASERANTVGGRFASRDHGWETIDTPARRDRQAVERDGETALDIPGHAVTRNTQMQRLAALALKRQALQETFTGLLDWSGIQLQPDAGFTLDLPVFDAPKRFRAESITLLHSDAPVSVTAVEDEDDVYDDLPAAGYHSIAADGAVTFASDAPFAPTAFGAAGADGAILWKWTPPPLYAEVVLYTSATADWNDAAEAWRGRASEALVPSTPGETRWGWVRAVGANGRESARTPDDDVSSVSAAAVGAAAPIYEALAENACPPADRGEHGQLWIAPDGRVFEHRSVFAAPPPDQDGITADGVDGVVWGIDDVSMTGSRTTVYQRFETGDERTTTFNLNDGLSAGLTGFYVDNVRCYSKASANINAGRVVLRLDSTTRNNADFKAEIEPTLFAAARFKDGREAVWWFASDNQEPYRSSTVADDDVDGELSGAAVSGVSWRVGRGDKRCDPANPLNPWVRRPDLGVAGTTYRELALYRVQSRSAAAPAAPAATWTFADGVFAVAAPAGWSQGPALPAWNEQTQFLWCSAVLLSSAATAANGTAPVVCDDAGDLNVAFRRLAATPSTPGDSKGESTERVPTDWHDTVPAQADPPLPLWMSVGKRPVSASKFTWSTPVRAEGQAGEDGATTEQAFAVTATNRRPASLAAGRNYRAGAEAPSNPTAGTAYRTRPAVSATNPYGWINQRIVDGQPGQGGDVGSVAWDGWALAEHYGEDGADGGGREWAFAVTATNAAPRRLRNSEAYDSFDSVPSRGDPVSGRPYDNYPKVSADLPWGWINSRRVPGSPSAGTRKQPSWGNWGGWKLHEHYGEDGATTEQAFAVTATSAKPASLAASRNYRAGAEAPSSNPTAGAAYRTRPAVSATNPYGWINQRIVDGQPDQGGDVGSVAWDGWTLAEHYGEDGADGGGREWAFAVTATDEAPTALTNGEAYDSFNSVPEDGPTAGTPYDNYPEVSAELPWGWINSRRVPGSPSAGDAKQSDWGNWGGWKLHEHFPDEPELPLTISHSTIDVTIPWDSDAGDWARGTSITQVNWFRGDTRVAECRVDVEHRASSADDSAQCRTSLLGVNDGAPAATRIPITLDGRTTYRNLPWTTAPCTHTITAGNVTCTVNVRLGARPPAPVPVVTADPPTVALFVRQTGVTYSEEVTWTKSGLTGLASYRTVRFSVSTTTFGSAPRVQVARGRGSLGDLPTAGTRQSNGTSVWTTPFEVEGVTVRVTVVYVNVLN